MLVCMLVPSIAAAEPVFSAGDHPDLDESIARHERQYYLFNALPFGLSLDTGALNDVALDELTAFLASGSEDVAKDTGKHPFELLSYYGEHGDLGMFAGVALAGTAFRYMTLKREGADAAVLAQARERVVRAVDAWHIFYEVTGGNGVVARGIRRLVSEDPAAPPIPGKIPELVPLFDADGKPLPAPKDNGTYRTDNSAGSLPGGTWIWKDSCSKDQLVGQIFGMVTLYDAIKDDPDIDQALVTRMEADALGVAKMLMEKREISAMEGPVGDGEYDLIIMDADGRPTFHHDLNPAAVEKFYLTEETNSYNVFNLIMGVGIIKGLHHVTGDADIEAYLYQELLHERGYLKLAEVEDPVAALDYVLAGVQTNYSNVNMMATALWLAIYLETDDQVTTVLRSYLETRWWDRAGEPHSAKLCKQPFFNAVYMGLTDRGISAELTAQTAKLLSGYQLGPYVNHARINCDLDELAAGECLAVDGVTKLTLAPETIAEGNAQAVEALDPSIRPPSNFDARSNPFKVNGGGGLRLNPGGDLLAAYWMARYLTATKTGQANGSPLARDHIPVGPAEEPEQPPVDEPPIDNPPPDAPPIDEPEPEPVAAQTSTDNGCSAGHRSGGDFAGLCACLVFLLAARIREKTVPLRGRRTESV